MSVLPVLLIFVILIESLAPVLMKGLSPLGTTALMRTLELVGMLTVLRLIPYGLSRAGLSFTTLAQGVQTGIVWSLIFALVVTITGGILQLNHINPFTLIASPLPVKGGTLGLFMVTGVLIAPAAEELLFRGVLYAYLRKFNLVFALVVSTLIFAGFHYNGSGLPLVQAIGGIVFALAFEHSKNLAAPLIIHSLGNIVIFSTSLFIFGS